MWNIKKRERYAVIEEDSENPNSNKGTFYMSPRHVKHRVTKEFVEYVYVENPTFASENNCRVFAQCSKIAIEVYDYYNKIFDPDYENVSVHDERFDLQYLFNPPDNWNSVDHYNPRVSVTVLDDGVDIKKLFDTDYGADTLEITYAIRIGLRLKHTISFINKMAGQNTFRVVMQSTGITGSKVKYGEIEEEITGETHIIAPVMVFGEDDQHLKLSEYLWSLGDTDKDTGEWLPVTLKDIIIDTHVNGCKVDIIIGDYILDENENLLIDPDTDTWSVSAAGDDGGYYDTTFSNSGNEIYFIHNSLVYHDFFRFTNVTIPNGSTITSAYWNWTQALQSGWGGGSVQIQAFAEDSSTQIADIADFDGRTQTTASVGYNPQLTNEDTQYTSPDITTVIQEIISRDGWNSGNYLQLALDQTNTAPDGGRVKVAYCQESATPTELEVVWDAPSGLDPLLLYEILNNSDQIAKIVDKIITEPTLTTTLVVDQVG